VGPWRRLCTFATFLHRLQCNDAALRALAEIIHDIDLKDSPCGRLEAPGVSQMVQGLCTLHEDDAERVEAGIALCNARYTALDVQQAGNHEPLTGG